MKVTILIPVETEEEPKYAVVEKDMEIVPIIGDQVAAVETEKYGRVVVWRNFNLLNNTITLLLGKYNEDEEIED